MERLRSETIPRTWPALALACGLCVFAFLGCDAGGELTSTPPIPSFPPSDQPRTDLVGAEGAMKLNDLASEAVVKAVSIVKEIRTGKDVERNFPIFAQYMNEMMTCKEQMEGVIAGLDQDETLKVNRHVLADQRQPDSAKAIETELRRIAKITGVSSQVTADVKAMSEQFKKRSAAYNARVAANAQRHVSQPDAMFGGGTNPGSQTAEMPPAFGPGAGDPGGTAPSPFGQGVPPGGFGSGPPPGFGGDPGELGGGPPPGFGIPPEAMGGGSPFGTDPSGSNISSLDPEALIEIANRGMGPGRHAALRQLAALDPSESSAETKKKVALALRSIAAGERMDDTACALAVEGMVVWAGKYAAPELVKILNRSDDAMFNRETNRTVLRCLGEIKNPDTLEPIVLGFAKESFDDDAAAECIVQFGPAAEELVLKHCRPGNPLHSRKVIYVLGKIGGKKSLTALESLSRTMEGAMLRSEIATAANQIRSRMKEKKK